MEVYLLKLAEEAIIYLCILNHVYSCQQPHRHRIFNLIFVAEATSPCLHMCWWFTVVFLLDFRREKTRWAAWGRRWIQTSIEEREECRCADFTWSSTGSVFDLMVAQDTKQDVKSPWITWENLLCGFHLYEREGVNNLAQSSYYVMRWCRMNSKWQIFNWCVVFDTWL